MIEKTGATLQGEVKAANTAMADLTARAYDIQIPVSVDENIIASNPLMAIGNQQVNSFFGGQDAQTDSVQISLVESEGIELVFLTQDQQDSAIISTLSSPFGNNAVAKAAGLNDLPLLNSPLCNENADESLADALQVRSESVLGNDRLSDAGNVVSFQNASSLVSIDVDENLVVTEADVSAPDIPENGINPDETVNDTYDNDAGDDTDGNTILDNQNSDTSDLSPPSFDNPNSPDSVDQDNSPLEIIDDGNKGHGIKW